MGGDGYRIVLESLDYYARRLRNMQNSPGIAESGMFAMILGQAAASRYPEVVRTKTIIGDFLAGTDNVQEASSTVDTIINALNCLESDIQRARNGSEYYRRQVGDADYDERKLKDICDAKYWINRFE